MPGVGIVSLVKQDLLGKSPNTIYNGDCESCDCESCDCDSSTCEGGHCQWEG